MKTNISFRKVSPQAALSMGGMSQAMVDEVRTTKGQRENLACLACLDWDSTDPGASH